MSPLDLGYASSVLAQRGVANEILDVEAHPAPVERVQQQLRDLAPSHLILHAITPGVPNALRLARFAKTELPSVEKVFLVGQHATVLPHTVLGHGSPIDVCLRGEFEQDVADAICGDVRALDSAVFRDGAQQRMGEVIREVQDLDALPFPPHHRFRSRRYRVFHPTGVRRRWRWGFVMSSRGCPYHCVYCSPTLRNSYGRGYRVRSTESVVEELHVLQSLGFTIVHFKDDLFAGSKERVHALCEGIRSRGLRVAWTAQTRPDTVDRPLLRAMAQAGCRTIGFGVETGSPRVIRRLRKGNRVEHVREAFRFAREVGIRTVGFFILGSPGETEEDVEATYRLMREISPNIIQVAFFTPYPGSAAYDEAMGAKYEPEDFSHYNRAINLSAISDERLRAWQRKFYMDFLTRTRFSLDYVRSEWLPAAINADAFVPFLRLSARFLLRR